MILRAPDQGPHLFHKVNKISPFDEINQVFHTFLLFLYMTTLCFYIHDVRINILIYSEKQARRSTFKKGVVSIVGSKERGGGVMGEAEFYPGLCEKGGGIL